MDQKEYDRSVWSLFAVSVSLPTIAWGISINWSLASLSIYQWFPLFGMVAWMIMCTHFFTGATRIKFTNLEQPKYYSKATGYIVLCSTLLHPGLLAYAQFKNGAGLPPYSYYRYAGDSMKLVIILGIVSLLTFLSFEFFNRLKSNKTVKKYWAAVSISQSVAMMLIFVHGLRLGNNLGTGWFKIVWIVYGLSLVPCFYIIHKRDFGKQDKTSTV